MNYLIFDIECCDGQHICEFGYLIFDEKFNILERDCWTINPALPFKLAPHGKQGTISLHFTEQQYYDSPEFPHFHGKIKSLIEGDRQIIGFSSQSDKKFLATACARYNLLPIKYESLDFQKLYKIYKGAPNVTSVEKMLNELQIEEVVLHKSDEDAYAVMLALSKICLLEGLSIQEVLSSLNDKLQDINKKRAQAKAKAKAEKKKRYYRDRKKPVTIGDIRAVQNDEE